MNPNALAALRNQPILKCPHCDLTGAKGSLRTHIMFTHMTPEQHAASFWAKVNKTEGCWLWTSYRNEHGYGLLSFRGVKNRRAHRIAWELTNGAIPHGLQVLHRCDVRTCVRPDHLFLGTNADNLLDCAKKGRNVACVLTHDQVREVRKLLPSMKQRAIAARFGVKHGVISDIKLGLTYAHVPPLPAAPEGEG